MDMIVGLLQDCTLPQLEELCLAWKIDIPDGKKGKRLSIFNLILRMLTSDEVESGDDQGEAIFLKLMEDLHILKGEQENKIDVKDRDEDVNPNSATERKVNTVRTKIELSKLREFRVVGNIDAENGLEYMSLSYQIQEGKAVGYSQKEIMAGVIKAIKAGSSLRRYLEGRPDITEENFMQILRAHYNVKDSSTLFNEMANAAQETTESELNYVLRMMSLRDNVLILSREEACPFEENLVRRRFFHSLSVGFRKDTIRLEAQSLLRDCSLSDEVLLKEISELVAREGEHMKKVKGGKGGALVGMVETETRQTAVESKILQELSSLTESLSSIKGEMKEMKKKMKEVETGHSENKTGSYQKRVHFVKCEECKRTGAFCDHCSRCGGSDHKRRDCPKN